MILTFRKPRPIPLVAIIGALIVLIMLGSWQLQRLAWKEGLIRQLEESNRSAPLTALPKNNAELMKLEFRRVHLSGRYDHAHELHRGARYSHSKLGYDIYTPFTIDNDGRIVLVNRGWIPTEKKESKTRPETLAVNHTTIDGMIALPVPPRFFTPDNHPKENVWFHMLASEVKAATGLEVLPVTINLVGEEKKDMLPVPGNGEVHLRNDHLGYAITWFGLAVVEILMFLAAHIRIERPKA